MPEERPWLLLSFDEWISRWVRTDAPSLSVILAVRGWVMSRADDPFEGARFVDGFDNYLFRAIPGSMSSDRQVVTCSYWVFRDDWVVRCDMISSASWPI